MSSNLIDDVSSNMINTISNNYSYTYVNEPFTDETGDSYPTTNNPDWSYLLNWMNKIGHYVKPPSSDASLDNSDYFYTYINNPFTNENGNFFPTPQNPDWELLTNWMNKIESYAKPPSVSDPEPEPNLNLNPEPEPESNPDSGSTNEVLFYFKESTNWGIQLSEITFYDVNNNILSVLSTEKPTTNSDGTTNQLKLRITMKLLMRQ